MTDYVSKKIKTLSFVAMIMVVYIHSFNYTLFVKLNEPINPIFINIEDFISFHICRVAVPSFFMISGYLLLFNYKWTISSYLQKLKKRFHSLVLPYFLWVSLWTLFFITISFVPQLKSFINNPISITHSLWEIGVTIYTHPICYQFWFIRDLIVLVLCSPLLYYLVQKTGIIIIGIAYLNLIFAPIEWTVFQNSSLLFFLLGMAIHCQTLPFIDFFLSRNTLVLGVMWLLSSYIPELPIYPCCPIEYAFPFSILLGVAFIWKVYDSCNKDSILFKYLEKHSSYSFFLFGIHEPLLTCFKKISFALLGYSNNVRLLSYFVLPLLVYGIAINIAQLIALNFNKSFKLLTGGR
ncbi:acyltransferase [Flavobacterium sp. SUN046]|uniref:acyltransferase n=1 Tax=Flavobacterium sp. SUN046 TaxID=3002440 RepID=UPI002DBC382E|nr:acyltransferase [Flavobacterium sp. SUN046]MEC4049936.1 acyltransferase [Flavobacterium sp. SUN046]